MASFFKKKLVTCVSIMIIFNDDDDDTYVYLCKSDFSSHQKNLSPGWSLGRNIYFICNCQKSMEKIMKNILLEKEYLSISVTL